ncbi:MAG: tetratricopeptide repeat protein [Candidatus Omnitrophota bacterium]
MAVDKSILNSITNALKEETLVSEESIQAYQEDMRLAEKERLQTGQKRKELLDSLKKSVQKKGSAADSRALVREKYVRIIRDGLASEVEGAANRLQIELQALKMKGNFSKKAEQTAKLFFDSLKVFTEKKSLLEQIEKKLDAVKENGKEDPAPKTNAEDNQNLMKARFLNLAASFRANLCQLMNELLAHYESLETQIQNDLEEEDRARSLFYGCISSMDENKRRKVVKLFQTKSLNGGIEIRIHLYKTFVEQLARNDANVAAKVHSLARKKSWSLLKQGRYQQAAAELCYALHLWKQEPESYRLLANVFLRMKDEKKAFTALNEVLRLCPDDMVLRKRIAAYWAKSGDFRQAVREYREILERRPEDDAVRRELGKLLYENKAYAEVPGCLDLYLRRRPEDEECLKWIGMSWMMTGDWRRAIPNLKTALELRPNDLDLIFSLSRAYRSLGQLDEAIGILEQGLRQSPDSAMLYLSLGSIRQESESWEEAEKMYRKAMDFQPPAASLLLALGNVQSAMGKWEEAIASWEQANGMDENRKDVLLELTKALRRQRNYERAEILLKSAVERDGKELEYWRELAAVYAETGRWEAASAVLKKTAAL